MATKVLINPFVLYECPDCGVKVATDDPEWVPDCTKCGVPGDAMDYLDLCLMVPQAELDADSDA